ncbi:hypothetical protein [Vibrio sp. Hal054]|uniref:hypothetical protein n=1 Tax=Vibrio sp. Hal054 TaxID=3035158 RepID=UPI00301D80C9
MKLSITFDQNTFEVFASLQESVDTRTQVNMNSKALSALDYKCAHFYYDRGAFNQTPTERQVITFLRGLLKNIGLKLSKELLRNITITACDAEYLVLQLADPQQNK